VTLSSRTRFGGARNEKDEEKISSTPEEAINHSAKVKEIENKIDKQYINIKRLFTTHGNQMSLEAVIIFDDLIEFVE
jgi:hypothetical protein